MEDEKFALLKITPVDENGEDGEPIPIGCGNIAQYKGQLIDIDGDGAGTTEDGTTIRDIRRRGKAKLMVRFENLTTPEFTELMKAISRDEFPLTYFIGEYKTIKAFLNVLIYSIAKNIYCLINNIMVYPPKKC